MTENEQFKAKLIEIEKILSTIDGVHLKDIRHFINGTISVSKKGALKLPITLPADQLLHDNKSIDDVISGNWKIVPLLLFVEKNPSKS